MKFNWGSDSSFEYLHPGVEKNFNDRVSSSKCPTLISKSEYPTIPGYHDSRALIAVKTSLALFPNNVVENPSLGAPNMYQRLICTDFTLKSIFPRGNDVQGVVSTSKKHFWLYFCSSSYRSKDMSKKLKRSQFFSNFL